MVLRRFPAGDGAAANEARTLAALDGLSGFAPRLLAAERRVLTHCDFWSGTSCGSGTNSPA